MYRKTLIVLGLLACLFLLAGDLIYAEDLINGSEVLENATNLTQEELAPEVNSNLTVTPGPEAQWILGQVLSADAQNKTLAVKYPDYESDSEKNITIFAGENTTYENVPSLAEIKADDMISVDYIIDSEGKNIARHISLEKLESERILEEGAKENSTEIEQ